MASVDREPLKTGREIDDYASRKALCHSKELLDEIAAYLPRVDQVSLIRTNRIFHEIVARQLYSFVSVSGSRGRKFLETITETRQNYARYLKTFKYSMLTKNDVVLDYVVLADALRQMEQLHSLTIWVYARYSAPLLDQFHRKGITPLPSPYLRSRDPLSPTFLTKLRSLTVHGDVKLFQMARYRSIGTITFNSPMTKEGLLYMIDIMTSDTVEKLTLALDGESELSWTIQTLASAPCFRNVKILVLRSPICNSLIASQEFAQTPPIFPLLREFRLNDVSVDEPFYGMSESEAYDLEYSYTLKAGEMREGLVAMTFGWNYWKRAYPAPANEWKMCKKVKELDRPRLEYHYKHPAFYLLFYEPLQLIQ